MPFREVCSAWRSGSCSMGMIQHRDLACCFFSSLPRATNPRLFQISLVHSALPLLEPRVRGCKWNFVHWPWLSESSAIPPWQTETLLLLTVRCYLGSFVALVLSAEEPSLGFRPRTSLGEPLGHWNFPPAFQLLPLGAQPTLSWFLSTPYQFCCGEVVSSICLWS